MIVVDRALEARQREGRPVRVAMVDAVVSSGDRLLPTVVADGCRLIDELRRQQDSRFAHDHAAARAS